MQKSKFLYVVLPCLNAKQNPIFMEGVQPNDLHAPIIFNLSYTADADETVSRRKGRRTSHDPDLATA